MRHGKVAYLCFSLARLKEQRIRVGDPGRWLKVINYCPISLVELLLSRSQLLLQTLAFVRVLRALNESAQTVVGPGPDIGKALLQGRYKLAQPASSVDASRSVSWLPVGGACAEQPPRLRLRIGGLPSCGPNLCE